MTTTWTIAIDWNRTGNFDGTYDDVTDENISAQWFLGEKSLYQDTADDSTLTLTLDNSDCRFSPENGGSPLPRGDNLPPTHLMTCGRRCPST